MITPPPPKKIKKSIICREAYKISHKNQLTSEALDDMRHRNNLWPMSLTSSFQENCREKCLLQMIDNPHIQCLVQQSKQHYCISLVYLRFLILHKSSGTSGPFP